MTNGAIDPVEEAAKLDEIKFPEFTAKLITDTFDAIVSANLRQTEAYIELVKEVSKTLSDYINNTKDDIDGGMILQFLSKVLEEDPANRGIRDGGDVSVDDAKTINDKVKVDGVTTNDVIPVPDNATTIPIDKEKYDAILDAVATRIAANKYTLLKEMVKLGILRLVVEHGVIETKLVFKAYGSNYYATNASGYHSKGFNFRAKARTGSLLSKWVKASASASYNSVNVSTTSKADRDVSGSQVQIYGHVRIDFKTDYQPLAGAAGGGGTSTGSTSTESGQ